MERRISIQAGLFEWVCCTIFNGLYEDLGFPAPLSPIQSERQAIEIVWNFFTMRAFWVVGGLSGKLGV
jgi:hypothetical protein